MILPSPVFPCPLCRFLVIFPKTRHPERSNLRTLQAAQSKDPDTANLTPTVHTSPPTKSARFCLALAFATPTPVISTEATDSLTVRWGRICPHPTLSSLSGAKDLLLLLLFHCLPIPDQPTPAEPCQAPNSPKPLTQNEIQLAQQLPAIAIIKPTNKISSGTPPGACL